ncbi:MAG: methionyl-tRNA formyltransferase [Parcubacteria group bacterium Gr01-1014_72]|nr:MAG: methionyl-tRNA formyltransferase [Parcubacteria group bacterium Gr01-1014_72]
MKHRTQRINFVFFGSDNFSIGVLAELEKAGFLPAQVVTVPDRPKGRGLALSPTPVKEWALARSIPVLTPEKLDADFSYTLHATRYTLFIVASYGKIIPASLLNIPEKGALNVHPSLLPKYRGATPIEGVILNGETETGVSIIKMDEKVDHGPILAQEKIAFDIFTETKTELEARLAVTGGTLLVKTLPEWFAGNILPKAQNDSAATLTRLLSKEDGVIDLADDGLKNFRKFRAYAGWPGTYFYAHRGGKKVRVTIITARLIEGNLILEKVVPEGRRAVEYKDFLR